MSDIVRETHPMRIGVVITVLADRVQIEDDTGELHEMHNDAFNRVGRQYREVDVMGELHFITTDTAARWYFHPY